MMSEWKKADGSVSKQATASEKKSKSTAASPTQGKTASTKSTGHKKTTAQNAAAETKKETTSIEAAKKSKLEKKPDTIPEDYRDEEMVDDSEAVVVHTNRRHRRRSRAAAPVGFLVILLAIVGVVALVTLGVKSIIKANDKTGLITEIQESMNPVIQQAPVAFTDVNNTKQDALLMAAIWKITDQERIRQMQEKDDSSKYPTDDMGRMLIPVTEVEKAYASLFGLEAVPQHHTVGGGEDDDIDTVQYDKDKSVYHVPYLSSTTLYVAVPSTLKKVKDKYQLRLGFVRTSDLKVDDKGNDIPPTIDMAEYFQVYTVKKSDTGWNLVAVTDEKKK